MLIRVKISRKLYMCQTMCVSLSILNPILIFMHLALITIQYIKQYEIPDLLAEFSAVNKPF